MSVQMKKRETEEEKKLEKKLLSFFDPTWPSVCLTRVLSEYRDFRISKNSSILSGVEGLVYVHPPHPHTEQDRHRYTPQIS